MSMIKNESNFHMPQHLEPIRKVVDIC